MLIKHITEISDFKKREIEFELRNEPDDLKNKSMFNYGIHFDGKDKPWKVVGNRKHADAIVNTLRSKGKNVEIRSTRSPVSERSTAQPLAASKRPGNPVAKNLNKFNKPATHTDKKKQLKRGEVKHKARGPENEIH